jgi:hypothetical protein
MNFQQNRSFASPVGNMGGFNAPTPMNNFGGNPMGMNNFTPTGFNRGGGMMNGMRGGGMNNRGRGGPMMGSNMGGMAGMPMGGNMMGGGMNPAMMGMGGNMGMMGGMGTSWDFSFSQ